MIKPVYLPALGETMTEARIVSWLKKEGEPVKKGEPVLEIETDKATLEVEASAAGLLRRITRQTGETVPVGDVIGYIADSMSEPLPSEAASASPTAVPSFTAPQTAVPAAPAAPPRAGKLVVSPRARRLADRSALDVTLLAGQGSGPGGRIVEADVRRYLEAQAAAVTPAPAQPAALPAAPIPAGARTLPLAGMRKAIARRMLLSVTTIPHVTFSMDMDMTAAESWRHCTNALLAKAGKPLITVTAVLMKALGWALPRHPYLNAWLQGDQITLHDRVNIGVAVGLDEGLIVPVVADVPLKGVAQISAEVADLGNRARANRLRSSELTGATFTISNLGMFGMDRFTAIINPPEAGILALGRIVRRFVPDENDLPVVKMVLAVTLSADHRLVDGLLAAKFMADLRTAIEDPSLALI